MQCNCCDLQLGDRYSSQHGSSDAIHELRNAFDLAERSSPGVTDELVSEIVTRLSAGRVDDRTLHTALDKSVTLP